MHYRGRTARRPRDRARENRGMGFFDTIRTGPVGARTEQLVAELRRLELLDRSYTLAAQTFIALLPMILVLTAMVAGPQGGSPLVNDLIERFGLVGAAAEAVRNLITIRQQGVYWLGLVITVYSAFVLGRKLARTYCMIWRVPLLPPRELWRPLLWIAFQMGMLFAVSELRHVARASGAGLAALFAVVIVAVWWGSEFLVERLFTRGIIARRRLVIASGLVSAGRVGLVAWSGFYLADSLTRQAESFGPIGVVFALFTLVLATWLVQLGAVMVGATLTSPLPERSG